MIIIKKMEIASEFECVLAKLKEVDMEKLNLSDAIKLDFYKFYLRRAIVISPRRISSITRLMRSGLRGMAYITSVGVVCYVMGF
jgi:hypothetical protein